MASFVAEITPRAGQTAVRTLAEARHFSLPKNVQSGSGTHHISYSTSPGVLSRGKNGREVEIDHSPPSHAEFKKGTAIPLLPPCVPTTWKGQFYGGVVGEGEGGGVVRQPRAAESTGRQHEYVK
jgi:hypothetical protein